MANPTTDVVGTISVKINLTAKAEIDLSETKDELAIDESTTWTFGAAANKMQQIFQDQISVGDGGGVELNLNTGAAARKDGFGNLMTLGYLKFLYIKNTHATLTLKIFNSDGADIKIISASADTVDLPPGGVFLWVCPTHQALSLGTNNLLRLTASATGPILVDVAFGGDAA